MVPKIFKPTLAAYFKTFGLSLEADDYMSQEPDADTSMAILAGLLQAPLKGQLARDSPFYIYRPPAEKLLIKEIVQPGALIRIRAPRQFGKTSLIARGLSQVEENGFRRVVVSLQLADSSVFENLSQFLQWLCVMVSRRLGLPNRLEEFWNPMFGSSYSCNDYFESYLLPAAESPGSSVPTMLNNHETLTGQDLMSFNTFMQLKLLPSKALINHQLIFSTLRTEEPKYHVSSFTQNNKF